MDETEKQGLGEDCEAKRQNKEDERDVPLSAPASVVGDVLWDERDGRMRHNNLAGGQFGVCVRVFDFHTSDCTTETREYQQWKDRVYVK